MAKWKNSPLLIQIIILFIRAFKLYLFRCLRSTWISKYWNWSVTCFVLLDFFLIHYLYNNIINQYCISEEWCNVARLVKNQTLQHLKLLLYHSGSFIVAVHACMKSLDNLPELKHKRSITFYQDMTCYLESQIQRRQQNHCSHPH